MAKEMNRIYALNSENVAIELSDDYKKYLAALCRLASHYVSRIRLKFARRAFEKYADPTVRKLVLAYGEEAKKLDEYRLMDFRFASEYAGKEDLSDSCLSNADGYAKAIWFLFGIDDDKDDEKKEAK